MLRLTAVTAARVNLIEIISLILRSLCGLVLCLVADPAERRGRHRTPYKLPLR
jgi:hypothetical protein